jgi:hypothetical protein
MWPFKSRSADEALKELVDALSTALGESLVSVLIFGSKASGEYREGRSNVNVFILLSTISEDILERMRAPISSWMKAGHSMPVFLPQAELKAYADNLPIEFLDMQDHHKLILGTVDPLQALIVDRRHLRAQCIQELSIKLLKLRQMLVLLGNNPKSLRHSLLDSLPSVLTLFRAVLRLEKEVPKGNKIVAAKELALRAGFDADVLERLWDLHMRRQTDNLNDLVWQYVEGIERVLRYVNIR